MYFGEAAASLFLAHTESTEIHGKWTGAVGLFTRRDFAEAVPLPTLSPGEGWGSRGGASAYAKPRGHMGVGDTHGGDGKPWRGFWGYCV